jgi:hypothetical protein
VERNTQDCDDDVEAAASTSTRDSLEDFVDPGDGVGRAAAGLATGRCGNQSAPATFEVVSGGSARA